MESDILLAALLKYQTDYYGYSDGTHTGFVNGQPLVDCSQLVYDGLAGAGYVMPGITAEKFSTHTLFETVKVVSNRGQTTVSR